MVSNANASSTPYLQEVCNASFLLVPRPGLIPVRHPFSMCRHMLCASS